MKKLIKFGVASVMSFIAFSGFVFALGTSQIPTTSSSFNLFEKSQTLLVTIRDWASGIIGTIAIIMLLYAAFLYMTAGGDEEKMKSAHAYIKWGLVGIAVAILAYSAMAIVESTLRGAGGI